MTAKSFPVMVTKVYFFIICLLIFLMTLSLASSQSTVQIPLPKLVRAEFFTETKDHKNKDTKISIHVTTRDGKNTLAQLENASESLPAERPHDGAAEYPPQSIHKLKLKVLNTRLSKADCDRFKVRVGIKASPDDHWAFNSFTVLYFSDNTLLTNKSAGLALESRNGKFVEVEY